MVTHVETVLNDMHQRQNNSHYCT